MSAPLPTHFDNIFDLAKLFEVYQNRNFTDADLKALEADLGLASLGRRRRSPAQACPPR